MSYALGEAAILTLIRTLDEWDDENTASVANDTEARVGNLVNSGKGKYLFLSPGAFDSAFFSINAEGVETNWQTSITLVCYGNTDTGASPEAVLVGLRENLMTLLDSYFNLNDDDLISMAKIIRGEEITSWKAAQEKPFVTQELTLLWQEVTSQTQND